MIVLKTIQKLTASTIKFIICTLVPCIYLHCADKLWQVDRALLNSYKNLTHDTEKIDQFAITDITTTEDGIFIAGTASIPVPSIFASNRKIVAVLNYANKKITHIYVGNQISGMSNIIVGARGNEPIISPIIAEKYDFYNITDKLTSLGLKQDVIRDPQANPYPLSIIGLEPNSYFWICNRNGCSLYNDVNKEVSKEKATIVSASFQKPTVTLTESLLSFFVVPKPVFWTVENNSIKKATIENKSPFVTFDKSPYVLEKQDKAWHFLQLVPYTDTEACALGIIKYPKKKPFLTLAHIKLNSTKSEQNQETIKTYSVQQLETPPDIKKIALSKEADSSHTLYALVAWAYHPKYIQLASLEKLIEKAKAQTTPTQGESEELSTTTTTKTTRTLTHTEPIPTLTTTTSQPSITLMPTSLETRTIISATMPEEPGRNKPEDIVAEEALTHIPPKVFPPVEAKDKNGKKYLFTIDQNKGKDLKVDNDEEKNGIITRTLELSSFFLGNAWKDPSARIEHVYKTKKNVFLLIKRENTLDTYKRNLWKKSPGWTLIASKDIPHNAEILGMNPLTAEINIKIDDCILKVPLRSTKTVIEPKNEEQRKALCIEPSQLKNQADIIIKPKKEMPPVQEPIQSRLRAKPIYQGPWKTFTTFMQTNIWQPIQNIFTGFKKSWSNFFDRLRIG